MSKLLAAALALLAPVAQAQLQSRDFDGNGSIDGYYDSAQNLTWLADANIYNTLGGPLDQPFWSTPEQPAFLAPGELRLQNAQTFLGGLVVAGVGGWRLPERLVPASGNPASTNYQCSATGCNPGAYWPTELTTMLNGLAGSSPFLNVVNGNYMSVSYAPAGYVNYVAWNNPTTGYHFVTDETGLVWGNVWGVHDGDVGTTTTAAVTPVPEPETYALMLGGLAALALSRRRASPRPA